MTGRPACDAGTGASISVRDTGATGDGSTDDSGAIQRALDSGASVVAIPAGRYRIGTTLRVRSRCTIRAADDAILQFADGAGADSSCFLITNADHDSGDRQIEIQGGVWDGNSQGNPRGDDGDGEAYTGVALNFINVERLILANLRVRNPESFSIRIGQARHFRIEGIEFDHPIIRPNQDGVHVGGFCEYGFIGNLRAVTPYTTNDDMVALNADDNVERAINLGMKRGPIRHVQVEGLSGEGVYTFVRLLSESQPIEDIRISALSGRCRWYAINLDNWAFPVGSGQIADVEVRDVRVGKALEGSSTAPLVHIRLGIDDLRIHRFERPVNDEHPAPTLVIENGRQNHIDLGGGGDRVVIGDAGKAELTRGGIDQLVVRRVT